MEEPLLRAEDYAQDLGDSKVLQTLTKHLRTRPEEERFQFISDLLSLPGGIPSRTAIILANTCLQERAFLEQILEVGLTKGQGHWIAFSLEKLVPKLGFRRVVALLTAKVTTDPRTVSLARYYLGVPPDNSRDVAALAQLDAALNNLPTSTLSRNSD